MNRILFETDEIRPDARVVLNDTRFEHIRDILHGRTGQTLKTGTVGGKIGSSVIEAITDANVTLRFTHAQDPLPPWCDVILAPPRPRVMKRLLPQLATLGVRRLFLVGAEKVEKAFWGAQLLKEEIYRPLLVEGLMQGAVSTAVPEIALEKHFTPWVKSARFEQTFRGQAVRIVAHPYGPAVTPPSASAAPNVPVLALGPEGGWTDDEVALLESRGFVRYALGARILKTDTAAVALLARLCDA